MKLGRLPIVCRVWCFVFRKWVRGDTVVAVVGWRSAMIKSGGTLECRTPCFWWFD